LFLGVPMAASLVCSKALSGRLTCKTKPKVIS
jgi:hypothetical protein